MSGTEAAVVLLALVAVPAAAGAMLASAGKGYGTSSRAAAVLVVADTVVAALLARRFHTSDMGDLAPLLSAITVVVAAAVLALVTIPLAVTLRTRKTSK
jgi:hypothetical protein